MTAKGRQREPIALDIRAELSRRRVTGQISVIVEGMPTGAALSAGTNNWDKTWSLSREDLDGLTFYPPEHRGGDHVLAVRVLRFDDEGFDVANTVALFDMVVRPPETEPDPGIEQERLASAKKKWESESDQRLSRAKEQWAALESERLAAAEASWSAGEAQRLSALKATWQAEADARTSVLEAEWQAAAEKRLAARKAAWQEEEGRQLAAEKAVWDKQAGDRLAAAKAAWASLAEQRLAQAEASWQAELAQKLGDAKARWSAEEEMHLAKTRAALESGRDRGPSVAGPQSAANIEDALAAARSVWEAETEHRLSQAEAQWRIDVERRVGEIRAAFDGEARERLKKAEERWKADEKARLAKAQEIWQAEIETARQATAEKHARPAAPAVAAAQHEADAEWQREISARRATADAKKDIETAKEDTQARRKQAKIEVWRKTEERQRHKTVQVKQRIAGLRPGRRRAVVAVLCAGLVVAAAVQMVRTGTDPRAVLERAVSADRTTDQRLLYVRAEAAVIRAEASPESTALDSLPRNTAVQEIRRRGEWVQIAAPGSDSPLGWMHSTLLRTETAATR